jgi:hypothetical protein
MGRHSRSRVGVRHVFGVALADGSPGLDQQTSSMPEQPISDVARALAVAPAPEWPLIGIPHRGRRVVYDNDGRELGMIVGDHVIGYTVTCWDAESWFLDLDTAEAAVLAEARSRAPGRYPASS